MMNLNCNGGSVGIAVNKGKSCELALGWTITHLPCRATPIKLIHVVTRSQSQQGYDESEARAMEIFLPYRMYCIRKYVDYETIILHERSVACALIDYASRGEIDNLIVGMPSKFSRMFKSSDIPGTVLKHGSVFCNVYGICKGELAVSRELPAYRRRARVLQAPTVHEDLSGVEEDDSSSNVRQSPDNNCISFYQNLESGLALESSSNALTDPLLLSPKMKVLSCKEGPSFSRNNPYNIEDELRRHKEEFQKAMNLYYAACREAQVSKEKLRELEVCNMKQEQKIREVEYENASSKAAIEASQMLAEKRALKAEITAVMESDARKMVLGALRHSLAVLKYQSLCNIFVVLYLFYLYFSSFK